MHWTERSKAVVRIGEETADQDETGFVPGKGSAYDYIPAWMSLPEPYSVEKADDPLAVIKLFTPDSSWTWYVLEYDPDKDRAFGLVAGFETELGYFSIKEMESVTGPMGLRIERDIWFRPTPVTALPEYQAKWGKYGGPYRGTPALDATETDANVQAEPTVRPEPKFNIGDQVVFTWNDDTDPKSVYGREWRDYEATWAYKVDGKWWNEHNLAKADTDDDQEQIPLPFDPVELPETIIDLDGGVTMQQMYNAAATSDQVRVERTIGVGVHHGKSYVHFSVDGPVRYKDKVYLKATIGPIEVIDDETDNPLIGWKVRDLAPEQDVQNLLTEHTAVVAEHPNLAAQADELYRTICNAYDLRAHYKQSGLIRFWLSLYSLVQSRTMGTDFRSRITGYTVGLALRTAFGGGLNSWHDIPEEFNDEIVLSRQPGEQLDRPGRRDALKRWQDDDERIRIES